MSSTLEVVPAGAFSSTYEVLSEGSVAGRIENRIFTLRERATLRAGEQSFSTRREGLFRPRYLLETSAGELRAEAGRERLIREEFRVRFDDHTLVLRRKLLTLKGTFVICDMSGAEVGSIVRERLFSRRLLVEYATGSSPPLEITLFLVWISLMIERRQRSS